MTHAASHPRWVGSGSFLSPPENQLHAPGLPVPGTGGPRSPGTAMGQRMPRRKSSKGRRTAVLAVYLPPELLERLRQLAVEERRSASTQALVFIEKFLKTA